jgi:2'-5' RNA ligase
VPLRLFVAAYPPLALARDWLARLPALNLPAHRPTPPEQVHLTLQFIGDTEASDLPRVLESIERSASGIAPFTLTPLRLISLPQRAAARLIAIETDAPAPLMELHRRLAQRLARRARRNPDAPDRFTPHLTLCRFAPPAPGVARSIELDAYASNHAFPVESIHLIASELKPTGAEHRPIESFTLAS